jgi:hypothetical protein
MSYAATNSTTYEDVLTARGMAHAVGNPHAQLASMQPVHDHQSVANAPLQVKVLKPFLLDGEVTEPLTRVSLPADLVRGLAAVGTVELL